MPDQKSLTQPTPINGQPSGLKVQKHRPRFKLWLIAISLLTTVIVGSVLGGFLWYSAQLLPVGGEPGQLKLITISPGENTDQIGIKLQNQGFIKSAVAFGIYVRLSGNSDNLQAGTYRLSPAETTEQIVGHLSNGLVDQFSVTFYPGATLEDNTKSEKKYDVTSILKSAGYTNEEIVQALNMTYDSPLFKDKPANTGLEGYVYGETYKFNIGATVEDILMAVFDEYYAVIKENNLIEDFAKQGLNLYQGITLASIVQRESGSGADQKQIAQVFLLRLKIGMQLGSDVTYQYIADKNGLARDPSLDSPYNTRRYAGLPPGPIAAPGLSALLAVAHPATGDYLYFLSGDDDITYFAKTSGEHEANIVNHCAVKCSTP
jgi:UPF0755 protein